MKRYTIRDALVFGFLYGLFGGAGLGALYGMVSMGLFSPYGLILGGLYGGIAGLVSGLLIAPLLLAWLHALTDRLHRAADFRLAALLLAVPLAVVIVAFVLGLMWIGDVEDLLRDPLGWWIQSFSSDTYSLVGIPAIVAAFYAAFAGWQFTNVYLKWSGVVLTNGNELIECEEVTQ